LSDEQPHLPPSVTDQAGRLANDLLDLLRNRNGFFAFGPALHVFPANSTAMSWGLTEWNMPGLWKHEYQSFVDPGLCFAEDAFGNQFSIKNDNVHFFQAETGELQQVANSIEEWAKLVLSDDGFWTGWPIAENWSKRNGPLPLHTRLHPAQPFVCGGSYDADNLKSIDAAEMMAQWGSFAIQIRDLPDGALVKIVIDP
jgi:hypothetical protein